MAGDVTFDIAVVGAGPAGLSAAVRAAWVESTHGKGALGLRVLLLERCRAVGGFARWRPVMTYGPKQHFTERDIRLLRGACDAFGVVIECARVTGVQTGTDGGFRIVAEGREWQSRSVVLATGLRCGFDAEPELFRTGRLLFVPASDPARIAERVAALEAQGVRTLLVFGTGRTARLAEALRRAARVVDIRWIEESASRPIVALESDARGVTIAFESRIERGEAAFIDSESYVTRTHAASCAADLGLELRNGFVVTPRTLETGVPGVFAAGDIAGPPLGIAKALGEGMVAGLGAYRFVYEQRRGYAPDLFPYYPP